MRARTLSLPNALAGVLLLVIVGVGVLLRMRDPLSGPLAAEDPYSHVVFTKEALERGYFGDSFHLGTRLYPPGIHAFSGIVAALSGVRLYDIAMFGPVVLGAIAIVGTFALANRMAGPVAGLTAALLTAVMPEHVFRTNLYAPTAFDLALVPAWLLLFHLAFAPRDGEPADLPLHRSPVRLGAAGAFLLLSLPLAFLHPWAVPLFGLPLMAYAALRAFRAGLPPAAAFRTLAPALAVVALATAFAFASRWKESDTGFADFFAALGPLSLLSRITLPIPLLFVALALVLGGAALLGTLLVAQAGRMNASLPRTVRAGVAMAIAAVAIASLPLFTRSLPTNVEYFSQLQPAAVVLGILGLAIAIVAPSRLGDLALSLTALMFPLTAINVFDSEFWPQRTVVYLGIGVALLAAVAVSWAFGHAVRLAASGRSARLAAPVAVLAAVLLVGGAVAATPASTYPWYRLYSAEHFEGFERTADALSVDPGARAIAYSWEPALMVKTLADPAQAWYAPDFYKDAGTREKMLGDDRDRPLYVVVDTVALKKEKEGKISLGFLGDPKYQLVYRSADGQFKLYEVKR